MVPGRFRRYVGLHKYCSALVGRNVGGDRLTLFLLQVGDHNRRTFFRKQPGFRLAHAVGTTGYDGNLVFQSHFSLPCQKKSIIGSRSVEDKVRGGMRRVL